MATERRPLLRFEPSFFRILVSAQDHKVIAWLCWTVVSFGFPIVLLVADLDGITASQKGLLYFLICTSLIGPVLVVRRVRRIRRLFSTGIEVPGRITNRVRTGRNYELQYQYVFQGRTYSSQCFVDHIKPVSDITILLDPEHPAESIILDFYQSRGK